jgi:broad specificity phosphatase PhoE
MTKRNQSKVATAARRFQRPAACGWLAVILASLLAFSLPLVADGPEGQNETVIFLVRHAEKTRDANDPALTEAGEARALLLAELLADESIQHVHSTDYARTRLTAMPLAVRLGIEVELYDPAALPAFADALLQGGGRHLVVGHSNTTTELVSLLGGEPGTAIDHNGENDRLYRVSVAEGGESSTELSRYGKPYRP